MDFESSPRIELTPPQIDTIAGPTTARLKQAAALAQDENWNEAIDAYRQLAKEDSSRLVAMDDHRFVSLPSYCQLQLAKLPADALAIYRRSADPLAERWYREAVRDRDEPKLGRIVEEFFCSSWGDDALLALGEIALERGDFAAARRAWEQLSPKTRDPRGRPLWIALRDIDLDANWSQIEKHWSQRNDPPPWLIYPDTTLDLAGIRARLILVSIRAEEFDRAAIELAFFRQMHPTAAGRFGGQVGPYVAALERLLSTARQWPSQLTDADWPTFAGSQSRCSQAAPIGPIVGASWAQPVPLPTVERAPFIWSELQRDAMAASGRTQKPASAPRESDQPISCFPIVVDQVVAFHDGRQIRAIDLATGSPAVTQDGTLFREGSLDNPALHTRSDPKARVRSFAAYGVARCTLNVVDGTLYSRVGRFATVFRGSERSLNGDRLIGIDLLRDSLLTFQVKPPDSSWTFDGTPVSGGGRVWVAMRHRDVLPHAYVACFDTASGARLWQTSIGAADTPAAGAGHEITHNLLTLVGDRIFFNSNLGLVAALDATTGAICWLHRYERSSGGFAAGLDPPLYFDRDPSPCLYRNGLLIVAPADSPAVFAIDADTGQRIWTNDQMPNALHLLGVVDQNLVISGNQLWAVDLRSGRQRFVWPESEHAGIRGIGRGVVAGEEIFWPTRDAIYVLHAHTGAQSREPIRPRGIDYRGANLAAAHNRLVLATHQKLIALGPELSTAQTNN